jgi:hypothetical protein
MFLTGTHISFAQETKIINKKIKDISKSLGICNGGWKKKEVVTGGDKGKYRTTFEITFDQQDDGSTVTSILSLNLKTEKRVLGVWTKKSPDYASVSGAFGGTRTPYKSDGSLGYFYSNPFNESSDIQLSFKHFQEEVPISYPCYSIYSGDYYFNATFDGITLLNHVWW